MATIDELSTEVADAVIAALGGFNDFPDLRRCVFQAAKNAAIIMSQRLNNSIDIDRFFDRTIEMQAKSLSTSQGYIQVIILAGYAGFFFALVVYGITNSTSGYVICGRNARDISHSFHWLDHCRQRPNQGGN